MENSRPAGRSVLMKMYYDMNLHDDIREDDHIYPNKEINNEFWNKMECILEGWEMMNDRLPKIQFEGDKAPIEHAAVRAFVLVRKGKSVNPLLIASFFPKDEDETQFPSPSRHLINALFEYHDVRARFDRGYFIQREDGQVNFKSLTEE